MTLHFNYFFHIINCRKRDSINTSNIQNHVDFLEEEKIKSLAKWIYSLNPYQFTATAVLIGFAIAPSLSTNEQNSFGNFLIAIGQVLLTVNAQANTISTERFVTVEEADKIKEQLINELNTKLKIIWKEAKK